MTFWRSWRSRRKPAMKFPGCAGCLGQGASQLEDGSCKQSQEGRGGTRRGGEEETEEGLRRWCFLRRDALRRAGAFRPRGHGGGAHGELDLGEQPHGGPDRESRSGGGEAE